MKRLFLAICALSMIVLSSRAATSGDVVTYLGTSTNVTLDINKSPFYWVPSTNCRFSLFGTLSRTNAIKQLQLTVNASSDLLITNVVDSLNARTTFGQLYTGLNTVFLQWNGAQWEVWQEPAARDTSIDFGISTTQVTTNTSLQSQITALQGGAYTLIGSASNLAAPADSTTYYFGMLYADPFGTSATLSAMIVPKTGTVRAFYVRTYIQSIMGSTEDVTVVVRHNNTTDFGSTVFDWDASNSVASSTGLSQAVTAGDTLIFKVTTPAWVTNPTNVRLWGVVYIE